MSNDEAAVDAFIDAVEACQPALVGVVEAGHQLHGGTANTVTHAGPPLEDTLDGGPLVGAIVGALLHEGWALDDAQEAAVTSGALDLRANQDNGRVAPLAGVITSSMPLWMVRDAVSATTTYTPVNEGVGAVLRYGAFGPKVIDRLNWIREVAGAALGLAVRDLGPIALRPFIADGLLHGDEMHNRTTWTSSHFADHLKPALVALSLEGSAVAAFMRQNHFAFLNLSIAFAKCVLDSVAPVAPPGVVLAMGANGSRFGIKVAGTRGWMTAASPDVHGRLDEGRLPSDASRLLGDSATIEALGLGGLALSTAPEIGPFLGCSPDERARRTRAGYSSTIGEHRSLRLADGRGAPLGLSVDRVLSSTVAPAIDAGIAHRTAGVGQIGAGLSEIPAECLHQARHAITYANP